jgi:hypothetical protein
LLPLVYDKLRRLTGACETLIAHTTQVSDLAPLRDMRLKMLEEINDAPAETFWIKVGAEKAKKP